MEAHGSFAHHHCIDCKSSYPEDLMKRAISQAEVPHCLTPQCNGLVKPDIVFFGETLPEEFHKNRSLPRTADLCIVMGTSLSVQPFASLPSFCEEGVPRILINQERVGGLGSRTDDVLVLGDCDTGIRKLATALGWISELEALWKNTAPNGEAFVQDQDQKAIPKTKDQKLNDEIATMTDEIDKSLKISGEYGARLRDQLANEMEEKETGEDWSSISTAGPESSAGSQAKNEVSESAGNEGPQRTGDAKPFTRVVPVSSSAGTSASRTEEHSL